jgi:predicted ATPase
MHRFYDFKNFTSAELDLFKPVSLVIGKNGSGKTNAIEAIELLSNIANGRPMYEITDIGRGSGGGFEIRGGLQGCPSSGKHFFRLEFAGAYKFFDETQPFTYAVEVRVNPQPAISSESLVIGGRTIFSATSSGRGDLLTTVYDNFARGGNKPVISLSSERSVLSRYQLFTAELESRGEKYKEARRFVGAIAKYLKGSFTFDPDPKAMRSYERIGQKVLARNGANLSAVLYSLHGGSAEEKSALGRIIELIKHLPEEPFLDCQFVTTTQNDVLFGLREQQNGPVMDARVLSDGTLRALAVLTALETVDKGSRVVVEEFDNGVHPTRVGVLTDAIWECSKRRNLNVVATTHNPATLDSLDEDQLTAVVVCFSDSRMHQSRLVPLLSLPRADVLLAQGHLGDLVTRKVLERHLMPHFEEDQRAAGKAWLTALDKT